MKHFLCVGVRFRIIFAQCGLIWKYKKKTTTTEQKKKKNKMLDRVSFSIITDPGPVKTFLTLSNVTLHMRFQLRAQTQQLILKAEKKIRPDK